MLYKDKLVRCHIVKL